MAKPGEKIMAVKLRKQGKSINSIANQLCVSKSTVSYWCKDITLTQGQIDKIAQETKHHATKALLQSAEKQRRERQKRVIAETHAGKTLVGKMSSRDIIMIGLGLYWGEGYKKGSQELGFTNSDPQMIRFYLHWLKITFNIESERLIFRVSINDLHKERENEVMRYWSRVVDAPLDQFTKTSFIKTQSKKYENHSEHYGTLRVKVRRGTMLRHKILGAITALNVPRTH